MPATIAPQPASFHFIDTDNPVYWDSILELANSNPHMLFIGRNKPPQVDHSQWAGYLSYRSNPQPTAEDIDRLLSDPEGPAMVMLEELHNAESQAFFVAIANRMRTEYPQWEGRWGAFLSFGNYPLLGDGIDALLKANAAISLELYPRQTEYCAAGTNGGQRDIWLARQFNGDATLGRVNWLKARRALHSSSSQITPLFGVGDILLNGTSPALFLDRMFYVWKTRTSHSDLIRPEVGGVGTYKWQPVADTPGRYGVGNTSRDLAFVQSYNHYSVQGASNSLKGPVPCP